MRQPAVKAAPPHGSCATRLPLHGNQPRRPQSPLQKPTQTRTSRYRGQLQGAQLNQTGGTAQCRGQTQVPQHQA